MTCRHLYNYVYLLTAKEKSDKCSHVIPFHKNEVSDTFLSEDSLLSSVDQFGAAFTFCKEKEQKWKWMNLFTWSSKKKGFDFIVSNCSTWCALTSVRINTFRSWSSLVIVFMWIHLNNGRLSGGLLGKSLPKWGTNTRADIDMQPQCTFPLLSCGAIWKSFCLRMQSSGWNFSLEDASLDCSRENKPK